MVELEIEVSAELVVVDRAECYIHIVLRSRIVLDLFPQTFQPQEVPQRGNIGRQRLARAPHEKAERVLALVSRTPLRARLAANYPTLQRMHVLESLTSVEIQNHRGHPPRAHAAGNRALDQRLDVRGRIVQVPRPPIDVLPFDGA